MKKIFPIIQMNLYFKQWFFIPVFFFSYFVFAQSLDSLEQVLATKSLTPEEKMEIYKDLSWGYYTDINIEQSISYSKKGLEIARKIKNKNREATFLKILADAHYMSGKYDTAKIHLDNALPVAEEADDYVLESSIYNSYANIFHAEGDYNNALNKYFGAVKILDKHNDIHKLTILYSNIGGIYQMMQNYDQALKYFKKAEELAKKSGDKSNLGIVYVSYSDIALNQKQSPEIAIDYASKAVDIFRELEDFYKESYALQALAQAYSNDEDYQNAETISLESVKIARELGIPNLIADALTILSNIQNKQGKYNESVTTALEVLKIDSTDTNITKNIYANLALNNAYLGQPDLTRKYLDKYKEIFEKYSNDSYQKSLSSLEIKYETEKKELKIQALEKQRQTYIWLGIAAVIILLSALGFAYTRYRLAVSQRKLAEKENHRLEQEKQLSATQALLQGQEDERSRMAKELHDGLGGLLSGVKLNLNHMQKRLIITEEDGANFEKSIHLLDESINELRRVAHNMMPESILKFGLDGAIREFLQSIQNEKLNMVYQSYHIEDGINKQLDISTYRIVQELVNNAIKHAEADEILVQIRKDENLLIIDVEDNGKGFNPDEISKESGMGLAGIRSRVNYWKGKLEIDSGETGTAVHIEIPVG